MKVRIIQSFALATFVLACLFGQSAQARDYSPQRLGSFAGAMKYCEDEDGRRSSRYRNARRNVAREVDGMNRQEKSRAIEARDRAYSSGRFMGKRLDRQSCQDLVRQSEWNRYR